MNETLSSFVIGAIKPRDRVDNILKQLQAAGIPEKDISLVAPDDREGRDPAEKKPRENAAGVAVFTVCGALPGSAYETGGMSGKPDRGNPEGSGCRIAGQRGLAQARDQFGYLL